ncbi:methyltransferase domain-containing protein [Synechococcus sp. FGCU-3]|nr:methyltransferase domain-containing protein [Synechococcus sp. FGCU3]
MSSDTYVLGTAEIELQRLGRQHAIWRDDTLAAWDRAGFREGQRLLDLGCGPGFAALDLAERVGAEGTVLAIDNAPPYLQHLEQQAGARKLTQLRTLALDLGQKQCAETIEATIGSAGWDGAWCRWLAMFVPDPEALVALAAQALRPGGRLVLHEYVQWDTFALHPQGEGLSRFVQYCIRHWQANGGDPHIARRLPKLLEAQGMQLVSARSLMACEPTAGPKARWLQDFLSSYPQQLAAAGVWSQADQQALEADLEHAQHHPSLWVTPALVEQIWERPAA